MCPAIPRLSLPDFSDLIGAPFADYGRGPAYDCLGLWIEVRRRLGLPIADIDSLASSLRAEIHERAEANRWQFERIERGHEEPGDLVLLQIEPTLNSHVGVVISKNRFLQACGRIGVHLSKLDNPLYRGNVEGIYRYVG